jgi:DNA-binding NarL/FixJ family response regulator
MQPVREVASSGDVIALNPSARERPASDRALASIRVLIAEGVGLVRAGLRSLLEHDEAIVVVAEARTGEEAVALAGERRPDVVVMDVRLPRLDGLAAARRIVADPSLGGCNILMLAGPDSDAELFAALRVGASGVLVKDTDPADLRRAVRILAGGGAQLSPNLTRRLIEEFAAQPDPQRAAPEDLAELTARERDVVTLVAMGYSNGEIAERLVISPATARTHVSRAMVKLRTPDRAKLVTIAYETGFVQPRTSATRRSSGARVGLTSVAA